MKVRRGAGTDNPLLPEERSGANHSENVAQTGA